MKKTLWAFWSLLLLLFLGMGVLWFGERIEWVGGKPLKIQFAVIDAQTRLPIPSAQINVYPSRGSGCDCDDQYPFSFSADEHGEATRLCRDCQCSGTSSWLKSTFYICLPQWYVTAKAPGYFETDPGISLDSPPFHKSVDRGDEHASLTVTLELSRSATK
jgi:hypothetical protein